MESQEHARNGSGADSEFVVFVLDEQRYAIPLRQVERIVRAVDVRPLPEAPAHLQGVVNVQGRALPVVNLRRRLGLPERPIDVSDHFVIAAGLSLSLVLPVDAALGSRELSRVAEAPGFGAGHAGMGHRQTGDGAGSRASTADVMMQAPDCVRQVVPDEQGMVSILDLDHLISPESTTVDLDRGLQSVELG